MKHIYKHIIIARREFEFEYDPAKPESYMDALTIVRGVREELIEAGMTIEKDAGKPVVVREKSQP